MKTPVRALLLPSSALHKRVADGLEAVAPSHRGYIEINIRRNFTDSIDIDDALRPGREQENRWDYLLGWGAEHVIALEPHSANNHEVKTVIAKKRYALQQLASHLAQGRSVKAWFWVASGKNDLTPLDKKRLMLAQNGITFVAPTLTARYLPSLPPAVVPQSSAGATPSRKRAMPKGGEKGSRRRR